MTFRIVTHNIQNGQPWTASNPDDTSTDIDAVASFLRGLDADIFCLQEVEQGHDGGAQFQPPPNFNRLKALFENYDACFAYPPINNTEIPFGLGLAIFSKTPLSGFSTTFLPAAQLEFEFAGKKRRASTRLMIEANTSINGRNVHLLNTHLQAFFMIGGSSDDYPEQRNIIESHLQKVDGPAIFAGDMNSAPHESIVRQYQSIGFEPVQNEKITWRRRPYVTDHIFYNRDLRPVNWQVVETDTSDHHAVLAEFDFA